MIGADDVDASKRFYDAVLGALGVPPAERTKRAGLLYDSDGRVCADEAHKRAASVLRERQHSRFAADSPEKADAWHKTGLENGGTAIEDPPGVREGAIGKLYLAYLRDPSGNKVCALHRMSA
jgi:catechol 2,3-dioxygenase-like lactoylglutathione lyase family enzyme